MNRENEYATFSNFEMKVVKRTLYSFTILTLHECTNINTKLL